MRCSTFSSKTMSAWLSPLCGRASGWLSIFTTSAGRAASAGSSMGMPGQRHDRICRNRRRCRGRRCSRRGRGCDDEVVVVGLGGGNGRFGSGGCRRCCVVAAARAKRERGNQDRDCFGVVHGSLRVQSALRAGSSYRTCVAERVAESGRHDSQSTYLSPPVRPAVFPARRCPGTCRGRCWPTRTMWCPASAGPGDPCGIGERDRHQVGRSRDHVAGITLPLVNTTASPVPIVPPSGDRTSAGLCS